MQPQPLVEADVVATLVAATIERDGSAHWRARGASMRGSIRDGETVRLVPPMSVERGSVAMAALPDGRLVVHRVLRVRGDRVTLRGDTCRAADADVAVADIVAVVDPTPPRPLRSYLYRLLP
jgi:hypothetical protein